MMRAVIDDQPTHPTNHLTRRERRIERGRARRTQMFAGWLGYGVSVFAVIVASAFLAVGGGSTTPTPTHDSTPASTVPAAALPSVTPSTGGGQTETVSVPASTPDTLATPATPMTTTTNGPVVAAVVAPPAP